MEWIKNHKKMFCFLVLLIILIPFLLHIFIFENSYPSEASNDGWAGFFGGYVGALIGAFATIIAITIEIEHNKREKYNEHILSIRPYLYVTIEGYKIESGMISAELTVQNLGFQAACGIQLLEFDQDDIEHREMYDKHFSLAANGQKTLKVKIDLRKTENYILKFKDIGDNFYEQKIIVRWKESPGIRTPDCFESVEPKLIQTTKEREEKINRIRVK